MLSPNSEFKDSYWQKVDMGEKYAKSLNICFAGLARNVESSIEKCLNYILNIPFFNSVSCVVFENDSSDNTKEILLKLEQEYDNLYVLTEDLNAPHLPLSKSSERTQALAKYRNICKEYIKDNLSHCDYISVIDLDFIDISSYGILNTFGYLANKEIQAVSGNSFQIKQIFPDRVTPWNYDSWAYRGNWWVDKQTEILEYDPMLWFGFWIPPIGSPIIKVNSAFGGMTTYDTKIYTSSFYDGYDCEHVCFHKNLYTQNEKFNLYLNPSQLMLFS